MQNLKKYVEQGKVQLARLDNNKQPVKIQYSQLQKQVNGKNKMGKLYQSLQQLSPQQRFQWTNFKRLRANTLYKEQKYDDAIQTYLDALVGLDFKDQTSEIVKTLKEDLMFPIILNMATCFYKKKQMDKALELCDKILADTRFPDCLFKKAFILTQKGQTDAAKSLAAEILQIPNTTLKETTLQLLSRINIKQKQEKDVYRRIFRKEQQNQDSFLISNLQNDQILIPRDGILCSVLDWLTDCGKGILGRGQKNKET